MNNKLKFLFSLSWFLLLLIGSPNFTNAQNWIENLPDRKVSNNNLNFNDFQKAFYTTYPKDIITDGTINQGGSDIKIAGWKLFKRWEWFMETRVDKRTGEFPEKSALQILNEHNQQNPQSRAAINGGGSWSSAGPSSSWSGYYGTGRLNCIAFHPNDNNTFWTGAPGGGLWKTTDGGSNWSVSTDDNDVLGVSAIALHPDYVNNNTIFIGTGDRDGGSLWSIGGGQGNDNNGIGVLKSTDGGNTWISTGLSFTTNQKITINEIKINLNNNLIMLAATSSGIYKTIDGGNSWSIKTATYNFVDMDLKPNDASIVYASTTSWGDSKIFKSNDSGDSWNEVLSVTGRRIQLAVSANNPNIVYAAAANSIKGLEAIYKSTNSGTTFTSVFSGSSSSMLGYYCDGSGDNKGQGAYDLCLAADPNDANTIFLGGVNTWKSSDGGTSWTNNNMWTGSGAYNSCNKPVVHADKHYLAFQNGTSTLFECNDGGLYKTSNGGTTWVDITGNMMHSQIYRIGVSASDNNHLLTGLQDNGTKWFKNNAWSNVGGGDGMECIIDYNDPNIQYACIQNGKLKRTTNNWLNQTTITDNGILSGLDGAWVTPYILDPNDHNTIYLGFKELYKSTDKGDTWTQLTNLSISNNIRSIVIAPSDNQTIYISDFNNLWKTNNGGTSWSDITSNLPNSISSITYVAIKNNDPNTLWVTIGGYNNKKVYQSTDGGSSWNNISSGLLSIPVMSIVQNKQNTIENELYVGTDVGVYQKIGNNDWTPYCTGLPNVVVTELEIYYDLNNSDDSKLWAGTFGRGLWSSSLPSLFATQNPSSFEANAVSQTQIDLSWNKNLNNDNVVLAWSTNATFGTPSNGVSYNTGDNINGGGTVLYEGNLTNFNHTSLTSSTKYFYKIWSYDGSDYSSGLMDNSTTFCDDISTFPYFQGFESGTVPPECWVSYRGTNNEGISQDWVINNTNTKSGTYSAFVRYEDVASSAEDWLVSPKIILPNSSSSASISYWERDGYNQNYGSIYKVKISTSSQSNHSSFVDLVSYSEADLSMTFTQNTIDLSAYIGQDVYVAFVLTQDNGDDWYLDDIKFDVTNTGNPPLADFTASALSVCNGVTIQFTDLSTNSPNQWSWDFGDGNNSTIQNPIHTYSASGTYNITLNATNNDGSNNMSKQNYITVNPNPTISLGNDTTICNTASITLDAGNGYSSYLWGNGTTNQTFTTNSNGLYTVTVIDNNNCSGTSSITVSTITCNTNCNAPHSLNASNITQNSANLNWTAGGTETVWELTWGAQGFGPGSGTLVPMLTSNNFILSGLSGNTSYDFYIKADCGFGTGSSNLSTWAGPFNFSTTNGCSNTTSIDNQVACNLFTWIDGITYTSSNNSASFTTQNTNGCDSIITLNLTINAANNDTLIVNACDSFTWNSINYSNSGTYIDTLANIYGCDSISLLSLSINYSYFDTTTITSCDSYNWNGQNYFLTGFYADSLNTANGCDSILYLDLTINNSFRDTAFITECDSFLWNSINYTSTGLYINSATTALGCDSIHYLKLTINNSSNDTIEMSTCDTLFWNSNTYTSNGLYSGSFLNATGCDSSVTIDLKINSNEGTPLEFKLILDDYCMETYWTVKDSDDSTWYNVGPYDCNPNGGGNQANDTVITDVYLPENDCYTLTLHDYYNDGMSASSWGGTDGSWIITEKNGNVISQGEGNFGSSISVDFYVTSAIPSNIKNNSFENYIKAYPNPFNERTTINIKGINPPFNFDLVDISGRIAKSFNINSNSFELYNDNFETGIYWLILKNHPINSTIKLVVY